MKLFPQRFNTIQGSLLSLELSFVFLIVITASVGSIWAWSWQKSSEESLRLTAMNNYVQNIRGELYRQLKEVFDASFLNDANAIDEYKDYSSRINIYLQELQLLTADGDEVEASRRIAAAYDRFHGETHKLLSPTSLTLEQKHLLDNELERYTFTELETAFSRFENLLQVKQQSLIDKREKGMARIRLLTPIPVLIALTLLLFSRRYVKNNLVKPLAAVMQGAKRISKGDLQHNLKATGVDELARLANAINTMADELATNRDKLIEAKKQAALGELVPLVAHNIRNPLAGIRAASQVTLDDEVAPATRDALREIIVAVDRLERWVTSLLTYLHPLRPHFSEDSLLRVADNALSLFDLQLVDKTVSLRRKGWQAEAIRLAIDTNLMEQTIFNLVQNALEAAPADSVIELNYCQDAESVQLDIIDQGRGMTFDPTAERATEADAKRLSCGLGIPFAQKVVKQHGGQLVYSAAGTDGGTKVSIILPLNVANESDHRNV